MKANVMMTKVNSLQEPHKRAITVLRSQGGAQGMVASSNTSTGSARRLSFPQVGEGELRV